MTDQEEQIQKAISSMEFAIRAAKSGNQNGDKAVLKYSQAFRAHDELVEAFTEVMGWISNWDPNFTFDDEWPETEERARAALAKAKGEKG